LRNLTFGQINFLHTTDTHGWYAGHLNQKNYQADWGDFVSFSTHLRNQIESQNSDLLLIDTGDKHDGNGLSDATELNGELSNQIFVMQDYDLLTLGNHELYLTNNTIQEYNFVYTQNFPNNFVSSNVYYISDDDDTTLLPFGNKYKLFKTKKTNLNVLALSFIFDFTKLDRNLKAKVNPLSKEIQEDWFKNLLIDNKDKLDIIIVFGHLPIQSHINDYKNDEFFVLHKTLRSYFPNILIQYFGGHSHVRDFIQLDPLSTALQSGRYCETVGFLSIDNVTASSPLFSRNYIDFNLHSFYYHSKKNIKTFSTKLGLQISEKIDQFRNYLNLTQVYGIVPTTYLTEGYQYPSSKNLYTFVEKNILTNLHPTELQNNTDINSRVILINTGSIRYDLYKGPFTKDSMFIVSPFQNKWKYISNLPYNFIMRLIYKFLFNNNYIKNNYVDNTDCIVQPDNPLYKQLTKGYITFDDYGCNGDDTPHKKLFFGNSPNVIRSIQIDGENYESVDLVFYDFLEPFVLWGIKEIMKNDISNNMINVKTEINKDDIKWYGGETVAELLKEHIVN
ncbi:Smn1p ASCRUDRAFT_18525, partial [Ascoidea rubescens DSM 1968]